MLTDHMDQETWLSARASRSDRVYLHRSARSDIIRALYIQSADDTVSVGRYPAVSPQRRSRPSAGLRMVRESHGRTVAHDGRSTQRDHGSGPVAGPMPY